MSRCFSEVKEASSIFKVARLHLEYALIPSPSIADYGNHRIQKYSISASTGCTVTCQANGSSGLSSNHLNNLL